MGGGRSEKRRIALIAMYHVSSLLTREGVQERAEEEGSNGAGWKSQRKERRGEEREIAFCESADLSNYS